MIKLDTPHESFVGGWHIDEKICDDLIQLFKDNKEHHKEGVIGGPYNVNKELKHSTDLGLHPDYKEDRFVAYKNALNSAYTTQIQVTRKKLSHLVSAVSYFMLHGLSNI